MQPPTDGVWGLPKEMFDTVPGYGPDVHEEPREGARDDEEGWATGPDKHLKLKIATRGISLYKDPAVILAGQLKEIWIDAEVDIIETAQWFTKVGAQGVLGRPQHHRQRRRRSRPELLRELLLQVGAQLHRLLQSRDREAVRAAVGRDRHREAQEDRVGDRPASCSRTARARSSCGTASATCMAALREGLHAEGEQRLQRLPLRGCLAGQVAPTHAEMSYLELFP